MTLADLITLLPLIVLTGTAVLVMLVIAFYRHHLLTVSLTLVGLVLAFGSLWFPAGRPVRQVTSLLILDNYALLYLGLLLAASFAVAVLSYHYLAKHPGQPEEYYVMLLLATLGSALLASSSHLAYLLPGPGAHVPVPLCPDRLSAD